MAKTQSSQSLSSTALYTLLSKIPRKKYEVLMMHTGDGVKMDEPDLYDFPSDLFFPYPLVPSEYVS